MDIEIHPGQLSAKEFVYLYSSTGWDPIPEIQIAESLKHDLFHISVTCGGKIAGMGRIVGDGILYWYLQNIIVLPDYQHLGIGTRIVQYLLDYIRSHSIENTTVTIGLMCSENTASFYKKFGFHERPYQTYGPGMTQEIVI